MDANENQAGTPPPPETAPESPSRQSTESIANEPSVPRPGATPPPAASIVLGGAISESSDRAKRELEQTREQLKKVQMDNMQLENENKRLKEVTPHPPRRHSDWLPVIR